MPTLRIVQVSDGERNLSPAPVLSCSCSADETFVSGDAAGNPPSTQQHRSKNAEVKPAMVLSSNIPSSSNDYMKTNSEQPTNGDSGGSRRAVNKHPKEKSAVARPPPRPQRHFLNNKQDHYHLGNYVEHYHHDKSYNSFTQKQRNQPPQAVHTNGMIPNYFNHHHPPPAPTNAPPHHPAHDVAMRRNDWWGGPDRKLYDIATHPYPPSSYYNAHPSSGHSYQQQPSYGTAYPPAGYHPAAVAGACYNYYSGFPPAPAVRSHPEQNPQLAKGQKSLHLRQPLCELHSPVKKKARRNDDVKDGQQEIYFDVEGVDLSTPLPSELNELAGQSTAEVDDDAENNNPVIAPRDRKFEKRFKQLLVFKEEHGHCNIPENYKGSLFSLGKWCTAVRGSYRQKKGLEAYDKAKMKARLTEEQIKRLRDVGFNFKSGTTFDLRLEELRKFKEVHGHFDVSLDRNSSPNYSLACWCRYIRGCYKRIQKGWKAGMTPGLYLTESNIKRLDDIGFNWEAKKKTKKGKTNQLPTANASQLEDS